MTNEIDPEEVRKGILERLSRPLSPQVQTEFFACSAIDNLDVSLKALRMALEAANQALGMLGLPDENGHLTEGCEMRSRWCAATQVLTAAVTKVEADGGDVIRVIKDLLALE